MHRDINHRFNFKFKATSILPLANNMFLVTDESNACYIIKNGED